MKEVLAVIRMNKMNETKQALVEAGIASFTARKVVGRGQGKVDYLLLEGRRRRATKRPSASWAPGPKMVPKRMLIVVVPDKIVPRVVSTIIDVNRTGNPGDGKIFVMPVRRGHPHSHRRMRQRGVGRNGGLSQSSERTNSHEPFFITSADDVRTELLKAYPTKVARKRSTQILVNQKDPETIVPEIAANVRTIPGIISQRGCTYAGCKGVVLGPTRDIVNITHGPIGCGFYSWLTRRNQTRPPTGDDDNFMTYCFSTDMKEEDIVFGGVKRLRTAIQEAYDIFHPKAIAVFSTCPVGLDRRRRSRRGPGNEGKAGHQRLRLQLRGLPGRQPVGRPPYRQQRPVQARDRPGRHAARPASSTSACWASTTSAATPSCSKTCSSGAGSIWWPRSAATRRWGSSRTPTWPT